MHKGFTLIELMATVIIIGILAAVALPQYTRGVNKARLAEAVTNMSSLQKAVDMHCTQFNCGNYSNYEFMTHRLDIDFKGVLKCGNTSSVSCDSKYFSYQASCTGGSCSITITPIGKFKDFLPTLQAARTKSGLTVTWARSCTNGTKDANMCKSLESAGFTVK